MKASDLTNDQLGNVCANIVERAKSAADAGREIRMMFVIPAGTLFPDEQPLPAVLMFGCDGPEPTWGLMRSQLDEWQRLFPALDCLAECRLASAWLAANPTKRKTARGMPRFLLDWLRRAQDTGRRAASAPAARPQPRDLRREPVRVAQPSVPAGKYAADAAKDVGGLVGDLARKLGAP